MWVALGGMALWGLGMGIHETVMAAAIAHLAPIPRRARAYGIFTATFGLAWFAGSAVLGAMYDRSVAVTAGVAALAQLCSLIPIWIAVKLLRNR
jgi:predicted MFS family arabinose efflux permease